MPENFSLMDKVIDLNRFNFEEATIIALSENWNSYFGLGWSEREWNEAFYLIVHGSSTSPSIFRREGYKSRIFNPIDQEMLTPEDEQNKNFCIELQRKLATANIKKILFSHRNVFEMLLMLGVALRYVEGVEKHNKILTNHWIPKFYKTFALRNGQVLEQVRTYYENLKDRGAYLTCNDLDIMNIQGWFNSQTRV